MRLAPGTPLAIGLRFDEAGDDLHTGRLAMADRRAQLEWSPEVIAAGLRVSPYFYPPEAGLQGARGHDFDGLHGFLADSLPDGWGAYLRDRRLRRVGMRPEALSAVDRLALVGGEGRGALVYRPATNIADAVEALDLDALSAEARKILIGEESALAETLATLGKGSGGARPKVHVGFDGAGAICAGEGEAVAGHDAWIVKFAALGDPIDIGPVEYAYSEMARAAGIAMAETRLIESGTGPGYFATRRFDRPGRGLRLHMVSFAGAIEAPSNMPSASYDTLLRATRAIARHEGDVEEMFRRMLFNLLAHNRDDHTRQHAYLMRPDGDWRLAPAYDLTYAEGPGGEHYLDIAGEGRNPTKAHVATLAAKHGLAPARVAAIIAEVDAAVCKWADIAMAAGVGESLGPIGERLAEVRASFG